MILLSEVISSPKIREKTTIISKSKPTVMLESIIDINILNFLLPTLDNLEIFKTSL